MLDLLVIGGGIHGAGIARDAAGRGLSVALCEQGDLAGATSSASSKLIHGGLRYLEHLQIRLVREALTEREILLRNAPHLVQPLLFVLPLGEGSRPAWELRVGLFFYDHLGRRGTLPASRGLSLPGTAFGEPLRPELLRGFLYADCRADDARLVIANARDAARLGADVLPRTAAVAARRHADHWIVTLEHAGERREIRARAMVNAAGPWAAEVLTGVAGLRARHGLRLVKGSHVVVRRLHDGEHAYILQQPDGRVVFVIPFERDLTLIGTTDVAQASPGPVAISPEEIDYLCAAVNRFLRRSLAPRDVVWSYAGTRALADDGSADPAAVARDDVLDVDADGAPLLTIYGGKLTTHRRTAERVLERLLPHLAPNGVPGQPPGGAAWGGPWTADAPLPGGDLPARPARDAQEPSSGEARLAAFVDDLARRHPGLPPDLLAALARRHGSECAALLASARAPADLGLDFGGGLCERELRWMMDHEWATEADDVLWRRSKAGVRMTAEQRAGVAAWMAAAVRDRAAGRAGP